MRKNLFYAIVSIAFVMSSCSDSDMPEMTTVSMADKMSEIVDVSGKPVIAFESMDAFNKAVSEISTLSNEEEKMNWIKNNYNNFYSIQDLYWDAMAEMSEIDEAGDIVYQEFKSKYDGLYFPCYKDDAGFYVPMSNLDASFFVNSSCEVSIAGKIVNLRDINDYRKLMDLGRAYYSIEKPMTRTAYQQFYLNSPSMDPVGPVYDSGWAQYGKRKVKLMARRLFKEFEASPGFKASKSIFHLEFCFRKKTVVGWANYKSTSQITFNTNRPEMANHLPFIKNHDSRSSHDSELEYPIKVTSDANNWYFIYEPAQCEATIIYRGVSQPLVYKWTMVGLKCTAKKLASHPLIVPYY